jgi:hypothetical protein
MSLHSFFSPKGKPDYPETRILITKNKEAFDFYPHDTYFINRNKAQLKNLYKQVKEKHKKQATDPYYTITIMDKVYNEYFMNNPEVLEILKEFNTSKDVEELKILRTEAQIKRIFSLKNLAKKDKKLLYDQMIYEFTPEKNYHELNYSEELTKFLIKNKEKFLKE